MHQSLTKTRRLSLVAALFGILPLLFIAAKAHAAQALPADAVVLKPQMLFDPVLGKNAYSVLTPQNWKMQGDIVWPPGMPTPIFDISVYDPVQKAAWREFPRLLFVDGLRENQLRLYPNQAARINQQYPEGTILPSGLEVRKMPASPREYVQTILIPRYVKEVASAFDVKIVSEMDLPKFAQAVTQGDPLHRPAQSSRFRMTYSTPDGLVEREFVATIISGKSPNQQPADPTVMWIAQVTTCRAPAGKLDALMPTFANIESSLKVQLPWYNVEVQVAEMYLKRQQEIENQMLRDQANAIAERARIFHEMAQAASDRVSEEIHQNFANQQAAKAQAQEQFINYINDTGTYSDPNDGSRITLSSNYKYHYVNSHDDEIIETNDPTYSPPIDPSTSWRQMEKVN